MICPTCGRGPSKVIDTRPAPDGIRRRRKCLKCGTRFSTREVIDVSTVATERKPRTRIDYLNEARAHISRVLAELRDEARARAGVEPETGKEE